MNKRKLVSLAGLALSLAIGLAGCSGASQASGGTANYPDKPIQMIVPFTPGGTTDIAARALAGVINKYMPNGQTVAVINKDGGGGTIGVSELFQAKGDGYTIGMVTSGPMTIKPHGGQVAYKPEDFKPVLEVVATPNVLIVKSDSPWKSFDEWLDYVKANPGNFNYSTTGTGLTQHITMESIQVKTGTKLTHVPFNGGSPAIMAMLGGNVAGAFVQTTEAMPYILDGTARPLFVAGTFKPEELKDVPMLSDKKIDVRGDVWTGIAVPKDVPDEIVTILHDSFKKALEDPAVVDQFKKIGAAPVYKGPADFKAIIEQDYQTNGEVLQAIGLKK